MTLKNLIGNYKKRRRDENSSSSSSSSAPSSRSTSSSSTTAQVLFHCREGSVTHYYHFFFAALIPLIEFHIANPKKIIQVFTDVGPFKSILCELPIAISELRGPDFSASRRYHDDKSLNQCKQSGEEVSLKGYDTFNNEFFSIPHFTKPSDETIQNVLKFFHESIPSYIQEIPTYDVLLIQRAQDLYYQKGGCSDRDDIYQTSGSERRSITNHQQLVSAIQKECEANGLSFRNISLERCSIYYQFHMFSNAKVVIAQHGAALANMFFMIESDVVSDKKTKLPQNGDSNSKEHLFRRSILEISPPWSRQFEHFKNLASFCKLHYKSVLQEKDHSEVDISSLKEEFRAIISQE